jgi:hypothetical protein
LFSATLILWDGPLVALQLEMYPRDNQLMSSTLFIGINIDECDEKHDQIKAMAMAKWHQTPTSTSDCNVVEWVIDNKTGNCEQNGCAELV